LTANPTDSPPPPAALPALSADEQRLLLVGMCDFEARWDICAAAAELVVDGAAKAALIRARLQPLTAQFPALAPSEVTAHQLWIARHWFDTQFCKAETPAEPHKERARTRRRPSQGTRRAQQGDK
jgi:hypothetical protein